MVKFLRENVYVRYVLTAVRIWIGIEWIQAATDKIGATAWTGSKAGAGVSGFLMNAVANSKGPHASVQHWYANFLQSIVLPHAKLFSFCISFGELLVGIALVAGCFTTFAALMGVVMNMAYLLAGTSSTNPEMLIWEMFLLIAGFNAGRFGLDYFIIPWLRRWEDRHELTFLGGPYHKHKLSA